jgi:hypothetical protein
LDRRSGAPLGPTKTRPLSPGCPNRSRCQAWQAAASVVSALEDTAAASRPDPAVLSLYGACQLVLAIAAARDNDRVQAHDHLDQARKAADLLGEDRDDYGTEFGPTNVAIHAVAVDLGDAGQALDLAQDIDVTGLSPERQARYLIDLAAAHAMRRQIGDALHDLQQAEQLTRADPDPPASPAK